MITVHEHLESIVLACRHKVEILAERLARFTAGSTAFSLTGQEQAELELLDAKIELANAEVRFVEESTIRCDEERRNR